MISNRTTSTLSPDNSKKLSAPIVQQHHLKTRPSVISAIKYIWSNCLDVNVMTVSPRIMVQVLRFTMDKFNITCV